MRNRKQTNRGVSMIEFTLIVPFWCTLLLGTFWFGTAMVRGLMVNEVARDLDSMWSRGQDFSATGSSGENTMLTEITQSLGTVTSTGTGVVWFTQLTYVGNSVCAGLGTVAGKTYGTFTPTTQGYNPPCTNLGDFVITQQYYQGNYGLRKSAFGNATTSGMLDSTSEYNVMAPTILNYSTTASLVSNFNLLPKPAEAGADGYQSGNPIFVVEAYFQGVAGFQGGVYGYAVF